MLGCVSAKQYRAVKAQTIGCQGAIKNYKQEVKALKYLAKSQLNQIDSLTKIVRSLQVELDNIDQ